MEKLTELQINPFLPHKLQSVHYFQGEALLREVTHHNVSCYIDGSTQAKILLHNIDCLTKTIHHEGREFIPLIELAKIEGFYNFANGYLPIDRVGRTEVVGISDNVTSFIYCEKYNNFFLMKDKRAFTVRNQYQLFQKLAEWHIDFLGLIEKGLAIDKNTLK